ncbi:hypothetical protein [Hymenobacter sp. AT01-02]|nr:hypothetical protein [Hymenobacter sp. AT01-02]
MVATLQYYQLGAGGQFILESMVGRIAFMRSVDHLVGGKSCVDVVG